MYDGFSISTSASTAVTRSSSHSSYNWYLAHQTTFENDIMPVVYESNAVTVSELLG